VVQQVSFWFDLRMLHLKIRKRFFDGLPPEGGDHRLAILTFAVNFTYLQGRRRDFGNCETQDVIPSLLWKPPLYFHLLKTG